MNKMSKNFIKQTRKSIVSLVKAVTSPIFLLVFISVSIVMISTVVVSLINYDYKHAKQTIVQNKWRIFASSAKVGKESILFDVTLINNHGALREFKDIEAYGLNHYGNKLVTFTNVAGLQLYNLNDLTQISYEVDIKELSLIDAEGIVFSTNDEFFAFTAVEKGAPYKTVLLIFDTNGNLTNKINASIYYDEVVSKPQISNINNFILLRTYIFDDLDFPKNDGSSYDVGELPIYITMYNFAGEELKNIKIRDYGDKDDEVYYRWNKINDAYFEYVIYKKHENINLYNPNIYTKLSIR